MIGYYYLHTNGSMIYKNAFAVESDPNYFDSDFVKKYWRFNSESRRDAWTMVLEGLALGMDRTRARELVDKWGLTFDDCMEMLSRVQPTALMKDGILIFAKEFLNQDEETFWENTKICLRRKEEEANDR